jgi:outer membrane protein assembly factor BamB
MVVVGSNDDTVYAYKADSGKPLWQYRTNGPVKSSFAYDARRQLILFGSLGGLCCALSADGVPVFAYELGAGVYSTPLIENDAAFVASLDKNLYAIEIPTGKLLWKYATRGRIFASPVMVGGSIYLGSNDGCLHEIDPRSGKGGSVFQTTERIVNRIAYNERTQRFFVGTDANQLYCLRRPR